MVQFRILSGKQAGTSWVARRFPVRIGRGAGVDLQSTEDGVWDEHLVLHFDPAEGFLLQACQDAVVILNGEPITNSVLRNGDTLELGGLKLQFWLSEARQRGLTVREGLIWATIAGVSLAQIALVYLLPK